MYRYVRLWSCEGGDAMSAPSTLSSDQALRVCLVAGSYPPELCGVGHYTERLADALSERGHDVYVVVAPAGVGVGPTLRRIPSDCVVHLQYPTIGSGRSLTPLAMLALCSRPAVLTLHEFSAAHPLRRGAGAILATLATRTILTSGHERRSLLRVVPFAARRSEVVPIGHNVRVMAGPVAPEVDAVYFGLLAPNKGLEPFLELVRLADERGHNLRFRVLGGWNLRHEAYVFHTMANAARLPVEWSGELDEKALSLELRRARAAYLPFPDGASERRASLLATLAHGVATITSGGRGTTDELRRTIAVVASPSGALAQILTLDDAEWDSRRKAGLAYAARRAWPLVARGHEQVYQRLLGVEPRDAVPADRHNSPACARAVAPP